MNFRQVHLDFHTSGLIPGIGSAFSKEQFQRQLRIGHVNSITVFSKCHHGYAYHPSKANEMHPGLNFDLLGAQIEAAHEIGVKTPVYLSAGLDEKITRKKTEWLLRPQPNDALSVSWDKPGWHVLCLNTGYLDYLLAQIEEVVENYDADGIFLDIVAVRRCYCQTCVADMRKEGLDPYNESDNLAFAERVYANYTRRVRESIDKYKPGLPVFHNGGHILRGRRDLARMDSHLELESLPTGGWGYDHFPISASYVRLLGMDYLGMTGKFHGTWGEFGGFKHPNALRYEAALSIANGAKCSIGDQLHPNGKMEEATYALIGEAYADVEKKEPWLDNVTALSEIAVLGQEAMKNYSPRSVDAGENAKGVSGEIGAGRILLEGKYLFDMIDAETPLDNYKLLILPDNIRLDTAMAEKIRAFIKNGGKLLATGTSGLYEDRDEFAVDLGASFVGAAQYQPVYLRPQFEIDCLENSAYLMRNPAYDITVTEGATVPVLRENPYFNRTAFAFCSHQHAPNDPESGVPAVTVNENGAYIAARIFENYAQHGCITTKKILHRILDMLIGDKKSVVTDLPAQGVVTLMEQKAEKRYVFHALYASPVKRGTGVEIIEDVLPVYNVNVTLRLPKKPVRVYSAPDMRELSFTYDEKEKVLSFRIDRLYIHEMTVIDYE